MDLVTNGLLQSTQLAATGSLQKALNLLEPQRRRQLAVIRQLSKARANEARLLIKKCWREVFDLLGQVNNQAEASPKLKDQIVSYGEVISARLTTAALEQIGLPAVYVDARRCIVTNESHGDAKPLIEITRRLTRNLILPLLRAGKIPVLGGFIGSTRRRLTTTLGRGSSDYTATLISASLGARETQIWTDVNGVLTADPHVIRNAHSVPILSFDEAIELSRFGAKVLHPKTIQPVSEKNVPLRVFNSRAPQFPGTLICKPLDSRQRTIKALAHKKGMTVIRVTSRAATKDFSHEIGRLFRRHRVTANLLTSSPSFVSVAFEQIRALPALVRDLNELGSVIVRERRAIICCVGDGSIRGTRRAMDTLTAADPDVRWQRASNVSWVADVPQEQVASVIMALHQQIFDDVRTGSQPHCVTSRF